MSYADLHVPASIANGKDIPLGRRVLTQRMPPRPVRKVRSILDTHPRTYSTATARHDFDSPHSIPSLPASLAAAAMACSNGPSPAEINNAKSPSNKSISEPRKAYRASVLARAQRGGDWDEKVRLYKEGLATARWTPSAMVRPYQTQTTPSPSPSSSTSSTTPMKRNSEEEKKRMFKIPTTILWGTDDVALDTRIMLDGIEEHFAPSSSSPGRKSQVVRVPDGQHWIFLEPRKDRVGPRMFERVLFWCVAEGAGKNEDRDGVVGTNDQGSLEACLSEFAADGSVQVTSY